MGEPARQRATEEPEPDLGDLKRRYAALLARAEAGLALTPGDRHLTALVITLRDAVGVFAEDAGVGLAVEVARAVVVTGEQALVDDAVVHEVGLGADDRAVVLAIGGEVARDDVLIAGEDLARRAGVAVLHGAEAGALADLGAQQFR